MPLPKISVIGAGQVGATTAHLLALKGLADVTLLDVVDGLAQGKALDMTQAAPVEGFPGTVTGSTDFDAVAGSRLVVITAGRPRTTGMSRDDLLLANANIVGPLAERIGRLAPEAVVIVVTNPLDVMVALTRQRSGLPAARVMGMAGVLDSARLRAFIAQRLAVAPTSVEAMILGSHGDLMVAVRSSLTVGGAPLDTRLSAAEIDALIDRAKRGGAEIVGFLKAGSAFYAPASGVVQMARAILQDEHRVLPVCAPLAGAYGLREVCIGVPARLGAAGIEEIVELSISPAEREALAAAAEQVRGMMSTLAGLQAGAK